MPDTMTPSSIDPLPPPPDPLSLNLGDLPPIQLQTPSALNTPIPHYDPLPQIHMQSARVEPLEIILTTDKLTCRGVGHNLEPALLSGHVVLNLAEATNIREITLSLVGKAKLPHGDAQTRQGIHMSNPTVYAHHWSFLPGDSHKHTIKAGRHVFPFQLELEGSLPASMVCSHVGAAVYYKLRAMAIRTGFSANFTAVKPISLTKSFSPEALEYNQTLEIENTWPGKIMYSIMIPHKAYAAGDEIPAIVRFSPMAKGVSVLSVTAEIKEYVIVRWRHWSDSTSKVVASTKFLVEQGKLVKAPVDTPTAAGSLPTSHSATFSGPHAANLGPSSSSGAAGTSATGISAYPSTSADGVTSPPSKEKKPSFSKSTSFKNLIGLGGGHNHGHHGLNPLLAMTSANPPESSTPGSNSSESSTNPSPASSVSPSRRAFSTATMFGPTPTTVRSNTLISQVASSSSSSSSPQTELLVNPNDPSLPPSGDEDIDSKLAIRIPHYITPTHTTPVTPANTNPSNPTPPCPLVVTHKVKFSVILSNLDGHTSELRCALPVHILDATLLSEARAATRITRNILFGNYSDDGSVRPDEGEEAINADLPSYNSHVLDRVAVADMNLSLPSSQYGLNPLHGFSSPNGGSVPGTPWTSYQSPSISGPGSSYTSAPGGYFSLPPAAGSSGAPSAPFSGYSSPLGDDHAGGGVRQDRNPLEFDQELMLSLGELNLNLARGSRGASTSGSTSASGSPGASHAASRVGSRAPSRVGSRAPSRAPSPEPGDRDGHGHGHGHGHGLSHSRSGLFHLGSMKPFSALTALRPGHKSTTSMPGMTTAGAGAHHGRKESVPSSRQHTPPSMHHAQSYSQPQPHSHPSSASQSPLPPPAPPLPDLVPPAPLFHLAGSASVPSTPPTQPHRTLPAFDALSQVPSYDVSSRGFMGGGVPPLELYRGLPTYDQAEEQLAQLAQLDRSRSEASLTYLRNAAGAPGITGVFGSGNAASATARVAAGESRGVGAS